jgi:hypothetical protein
VGQGVNTPSHSSAAVGVDFVAHGIGKGLRGVGMSDGVTGAVDLGVQAAQGEGPAGLVQEDEANCA